MADGIVASVVKKQGRSSSSGAPTEIRTPVSTTQRPEETVRCRSARSGVRHQPPDRALLACGFFPALLSAGALHGPADRAIAAAPDSLVLVSAVLIGALGFFVFIHQTRWTR